MKINMKKGYKMCNVSAMHVKCKNKIYKMHM